MGCLTALTFFHYQKKSFSCCIYKNSIVPLRSFFIGMYYLEKIESAEKRMTMAEFVKSRSFGILAKPVIVEVVDVHAKEDILLGSIKHNAFINAEEETVFFTHSDHLGSAAWITNENGKCIQYIHYAPFGELLDNQRVGSYDERF